MGTPHCGSGLAEWAVIGSRFIQYFRRVNQQTLEALKQKPEVMASIRQDFHTMLREMDQSRENTIVIISFYEELPVRTVGEVMFSWRYLIGVLMLMLARLYPKLLQPLTVTHPLVFMQIIWI